MIFYVGNPEESTRKLLEPVNKLSKVATHKNKHIKKKSVLFLSIGKEQSEEEMKKTVPFI